METEYKKITLMLKELPWLNTKTLKNSSSDFDLEIENFKEHTDFINWVRDIFDGKEVTDKFGNKLKLTSYQDKKNFAKILDSNFVIRSFVGYTFTDNEKTMMNILLGFDKITPTEKMLIDIIAASNDSTEAEKELIGAINSAVHSVKLTVKNPKLMSRKKK